MLNLKPRTIRGALQKNRIDMKLPPRDAAFPAAAAVLPALENSQAYEICTHDDECTKQTAWDDFFAGWEQVVAVRDAPGHRFRLTGD
jgi:hypothetical protein